MGHRAVAAEPALMGSAAAATQDDSHQRALQPGGALMNPVTIFCEQEAPLDLEQTESTQGGGDEVMLYVAIVDGKLQPRAGLRVDIAGVSLRLSAVTDERGVLFLDSCPAGGYTVSAGGLAAAVHTLTQSDVERSNEPYLSILR